jgi:hypothetical protein
MIRYIIPFCLLSVYSSAQVSLEWAANVDLELSKAGSLSHYFYNEIHEESTDWRLDVARLQGQFNIIFNRNFSINSHFLVQRQQALKTGLFRNLNNYIVKVGQLHLTYRTDDRNFTLYAGRIQNTFGYWYKHQSYRDRSILSAPLMYSYFTNISPKFGYVHNLGEENELLVDGQSEFGFSSLYNRGYRNGFATFIGNENKLQFTFSAYNGNAGSKKTSTDPYLWNLVAKVSYPINYSWRVGFSALHGTYLKVKLPNLSRYRQSMYSINVVFDKGFFNIESELFLSNYRSPVYDLDAGEFSEATDGLVIASLTNVSYYSTVKYEPSWLSGAFFAYRIDTLFFGKDPTVSIDRTWDNNVIRHAFGVGYKLFEQLSIRCSFSTQSVANRDWDGKQNTFRTVLSYGL